MTQTHRLSAMSVYRYKAQETGAGFQPALYLLAHQYRYEGSIFNQVAQDLRVDMRNYWRPDEAFLKRRNKVQLQQIVTDSGCFQKFGNVAGYKKKELVTSMSKHFQHVLTLESPNADELKATFWIPEAMAFPAIDPDADHPDLKTDQDGDDYLYYMP